METTKVQLREECKEESSVDMVSKVSATFVLGTCCLIGAWSVVCIASGIMASGGPVALIASLFAII